jgi:hypothetical protein
MKIESSSEKRLTPLFYSGSHLDAIQPRAGFPRPYRLCDLKLYFTALKTAISGDKEKIPEWQEFCESLGLGIVAIIHSDIKGKEDAIESELPMLTGRVHHLVREEDVSEREMVQTLARVLVKLGKK